MKLRSIAFYGIWLATLLIPLTLWLNHTGNPLSYFSDGVPQGQVWYIFSKLFGLLAAFLFFTHIFIMLTRRYWPIRWTVKAHQWLGITVFVLASCHGLFFITAKSIRSGSITYDVLIPSFSNGFYKSMVSLGVIASVFFILSVISGFLRVNTSKRKTKAYIHKIGVISFLLILIHSFLIGSEIAV